MGKKEKKQSSKKTVSTVSESSGDSSEKSTSGKSSNQSSASQSVASSSKPKGKSKSAAKLHKQSSEHGSNSEAKKKTKESSKLAIDGHGNTVINVYVNGENACLNFVLPDAIKKGLVGSNGVTVDLDEILKKENNGKNSDQAVSPAISVKDQKKADGNPK